MAVRSLVALAVLAVVVLGAWVYSRAKARVAAVDDLPPLPAEWRGGGARTWVVFTTPYCAACGPLADRLRAADPGAGVVTVDATRQVALADAYQVRSAPTALLAGPSGEVLGHFVGTEAVTRYLAGAV